MGFPIRVKQASRIDLLSTLAGLPLVALLFYQSSPGFLVGLDSWLRVFAYAFLAFEVFAVVVLVRNSRRELVIDDTSIRMLKHNAILWELPWERYGGYRIPFQGPVRTGIPATVEFLDTEGKAIGKARLIQAGFRADLFTLMHIVKALDERIAEGGAPPAPVPDKSLKRPALLYWMLAALGVFLFVFGAAMMRADESHRRGHNVESTQLSPYVGVMMAGSLLVGMFSALATMSPRRSFRAPKPDNIEGFMATHPNSLSLKDLQPGKKYRYVDADALRDNLDMYRRHATLMLGFGCVLLAFSVYLLFFLYRLYVGPFPWMVRLSAPMFVAAPLASLIFGIPALRRLLACNKLRNSLEDQVTVSADRLEVSHAGTVTSYPLRPKEKKGPSLVLFGSQFLQFESGEGQYWLDPRFLQEV